MGATRKQLPAKLQKNIKSKTTSDSQTQIKSSPAAEQSAIPTKEEDGESSIIAKNLTFETESNDEKNTIVDSFSKISRDRGTLDNKNNPESPLFKVKEKKAQFKRNIPKIFFFDSNENISQSLKLNKTTLCTPNKNLPKSFEKDETNYINNITTVYSANNGNAKSDRSTISPFIQETLQKKTFKDDSRSKALDKMLKSLDIKISGFKDILPNKEILATGGSISENVKTKYRAAKISLGPFSFQRSFSNHRKPKDNTNLKKLSNTNEKTTTPHKNFETIKATKNESAKKEISGTTKNKVMIISHENKRENFIQDGHSGKSVCSLLVEMSDKVELQGPKEHTQKYLNSLNFSSDKNTKILEEKRRGPPDVETKPEIQLDKSSEYGLESKKNLYGDGNQLKMRNNPKISAQNKITQEFLISEDIKVKPKKLGLFKSTKKIFKKKLSSNQSIEDACSTTTTDTGYSSFICNKSDKQCEASKSIDFSARSKYTSDFMKINKNDNSSKLKSKKGRPRKMTKVKIMPKGNDISNNLKMKKQFSKLREKVVRLTASKKLLKKKQELESQIDVFSDLTTQNNSTPLIATITEAQLNKTMPKDLEVTQYNQSTSTSSNTLPVLYTLSDENNSEAIVKEYITEIFNRVDEFEKNKETSIQTKRPKNEESCNSKNYLLTHNNKSMHQGEDFNQSMTKDSICIKEEVSKSHPNKIANKLKMSVVRERLQQKYVKAFKFNNKTSSKINQLATTTQKTKKKNKILPSLKHDKCDAKLMDVTDIYDFKTESEDEENIKMNLLNESSLIMKSISEASKKKDEKVENQTEINKDSSEDDDKPLWITQKISPKYSQSDYKSKENNLLDCVISKSFIQPDQICPKANVINRTSENAVGKAKSKKGKSKWFIEVSNSESDSDSRILPKSKMKVIMMPKRRMASLNALAKVQCLYENESRTSNELGLSKTMQIPKIRTIASASSSDEEKDIERKCDTVFLNSVAKVKKSETVRKDCMKYIQKNSLNAFKGCKGKKDVKIKKKGELKLLKTLKKTLKTATSLNKETKKKLENITTVEKILCKETFTKKSEIMAKSMQEIISEGESEKSHDHVEVKRELRNVPGLRGAGKHWDFNESFESANESDISFYKEDGNHKSKNKKKKIKLNQKLIKIKKEKLNKSAIPKEGKFKTKKIIRSKMSEFVKANVAKIKKNLENSKVSGKKLSENDGLSDSSEDDVFDIKLSKILSNKPSEIKKKKGTFKKHIKLYDDNYLNNLKGLAHKRIASLNASALVAATYELEGHLDKNLEELDCYEIEGKSTLLTQKKTKDVKRDFNSPLDTKLRMDDKESKDMEIEEITTSLQKENKRLLKKNKKSPKGQENVKGAEIIDSINDYKDGNSKDGSVKDLIKEPSTSRPTSSSVVIVQDTDVTITGVYVNATTGSSREAYCKMQYRVQSSVTEERVVSNVESSSPPKSYTPLGALTNMRPPGTNEDGKSTNLRPLNALQTSSTTQLCSSSDGLTSTALSIYPSTQAPPVTIPTAGTPSLLLDHQHSDLNHLQHSGSLVVMEETLPGNIYSHQQPQQTLPESTQLNAAQHISHYGMPPPHCLQYDSSQQYKYGGLGEMSDSSYNYQNPPNASDTLTPIQTLHHPHYRPPQQLPQQLSSSSSQTKSSTLSVRCDSPTIQQQYQQSQDCNNPITTSSGTPGSAFCAPNIHQSNYPDLNDYYQPAGPLIHSNVKAALPASQQGKTDQSTTKSLTAIKKVATKLDDISYNETQLQQPPPSTSATESSDSDVLITGGDLRTFRYPSSLQNPASQLVSNNNNRNCVSQQQLSVLATAQQQQQQAAAAAAAAAYTRSMQQMHYPSAYPPGYYSPYHPGEVCYTTPYQPYFPPSKNYSPVASAATVHQQYRRYHPTNSYYQTGAPPGPPANDLYADSIQAIGSIHSPTSSVSTQQITQNGSQLVSFGQSLATLPTPAHHVEHYSGSPGYYQDFSPGSGSTHNQFFSRNMQPSFIDYPPACPCPMQSCPKNVLTGPLIGSSNSQTRNNNKYNNSSNNNMVIHMSSSDTAMDMKLMNINNPINNSTIVNNENNNITGTEFNIVNNSTRKNNNLVPATNNTSNDFSLINFYSKNNNFQSLESNKGPVKNQDLTQNSNPMESGFTIANNQQLNQPNHFHHHLKLCKMEMNESLKPASNIVKMKTEIPDDLISKPNVTSPCSTVGGVPKNSASMLSLLSPLSISSVPNQIMNKKESCNRFDDNGIESICNISGTSFFDKNCSKNESDLQTKMISPVKTYTINEKLLEIEREMTTSPARGSTGLPTIPDSSEKAAIITPSAAANYESTSSVSINEDHSNGQTLIATQNCQNLVGRKARIGKTMAREMMYGQAGANVLPNIQHSHINSQVFNHNIPNVCLPNHNQFTTSSESFIQQQLNANVTNPRIIHSPSNYKANAKNINFFTTCFQQTEKQQIKTEYIKTEDEDVYLILDDEKQIIKIEEPDVVEIIEDEKNETISDTVLQPHVKRISKLLRPLNIGLLCPVKRMKILETTSNIKFNKKSPQNGYKCLIKQAEPKPYLCLSRRSDKKDRFKLLKKSRKTGLKRRKLILTAEQKQRLRDRKKIREIELKNLKEPQLEVKIIENINKEQKKSEVLESINNHTVDQIPTVLSNKSLEYIASPKITSNEKERDASKTSEEYKTIISCCKELIDMPKEKVQTKISANIPIQLVSEGYFSEPEIHSSSVLSNSSIFPFITKRWCKMKKSKNSELRSKSETKENKRNKNDVDDFRISNCCSENEIYENEEINKYQLSNLSTTTSLNKQKNKYQHGVCNRIFKNDSNKERIVIENLLDGKTSNIIKFPKKIVCIGTDALSLEPKKATNITQYFLKNKINDNKPNQSTTDALNNNNIHEANNNTNTVISSSMIKPLRKNEMTIISDKLNNTNNLFTNEICSTKNSSQKILSNIFPTVKTKQTMSSSISNIDKTKTNSSSNYVKHQDQKNIKVINSCSEDSLSNKNIWNNKSNNNYKKNIYNNSLILPHSKHATTVVQNTLINEYDNHLQVNNFIVNHHQGTQKRKATKSRFGNRKKTKRQTSELVETIIIPRKANAVPKWNNGWSWAGEPFQGKVFLNSDDPLVIRTCYPGMRHLEGDIIQPRDCVLLRSGAKKNELPYVAKVAHLWENPEDGEMMMSLLWYYRPEHTEQGRQENDSSDEVFASRHRDHNSVACIEDKCYVLTFNEYCRYRRTIRAIEENVEEPISIVPKIVNYTNPREVPQSTNPEQVMFCQRIYDFRLKRLMKTN